MMETILIRSLVVSVALSYSYATERLPNPCEDEKIKILKQIVEIQREKGEGEVEKLQALEGSQNEFSLEVNKLAGRLDVIETQKMEKLQTMEESQNELSLALNKIEGRLDVSEAQVEKLQTMEKNQNEFSLALKKLEDRLDVSEVQVDKLQTMEENLSKLAGRLDVIEAQKVEKLQSHEESQNELTFAMNKLAVSLNQVLDVSFVLNKLEGRLDVIETKMDTQVDEMKDKLEDLQRVEAHEHQKVEKLQTIEKSQNELSLALNKLEGRLNVSEAQVEKLQTMEKSQNELSLALNKLEGRLDVSEAQMDNQADEMKTTQLSSNQVLQRVEALEHQVDKLKTMDENLNKLEARLDVSDAQKMEKLQTMEDYLNKLRGRLDVSEAQVEKLQTLGESQNELSLAQNKLEGHLDVIEAKMGLYLDEIENKLEVMQVNCTEILQRIEDKLEAKQDNSQTGLQPAKDLDHQEEPGSRKVSIVGCQTPFEPFGSDCLFWYKETMKWDDARRYCQAMGAELFIPTVKEGFQVFNGIRNSSDSNPPIIDFLYEKMNQNEKSGIHAWIGAYRGDYGTLIWTSGEELQTLISRLQKNKDLKCVWVYVHRTRIYAIRASKCELSSFFTPICQQQHSE